MYEMTIHFHGYFVPKDSLKGMVINMKNLISVTLVMLFSTLILAACGDGGVPDAGQPVPQESPDLTPDVTGDTTAPATVEPVPAGDISSIKVLYNRIDWREGMDGTSIIRSTEELSNYYNELKAVNVNELDDDIVWRLTGEQYNDAFFAGHFLVLVTVAEPSGSNRHEVTSITDDNGVLTIHIDRLIPEIGTADMAGWLIVIELSNDHSINETDVIFNYVPQSG